MEPKETKITGYGLLLVERVRGLGLGLVEGMPKVMNRYNFLNIDYFELRPAPLDRKFNKLSNEHSYICFTNFAF